jgi:hypothetical protein
MGAKRHKIQKETVTIRLEPNTRLLVEEMKKAFQHMSFNSGSFRKWTNSLIIEHAIQMYYQKKKREHRDPTRCGSCDAKRD